jgi:hypothetical protein
MGIEYGKDYIVTRLDGESRITRNDKVVGNWPNIGFKVTGEDIPSMKTATELRAHAYAEVALGVPPEERQWVMTAVEYDADEERLIDDRKRLLETYPLDTDLEVSMSRWRSTDEADLQKRDTRMQLLNVEKGVVIPHRPRPAEFPKAVEPKRIEKKIVGE